MAGADENQWRGAAGRAYYALMLECREALFRWGFRLRPRENVHAFVRLHFSFPAHPDLRKIGDELDQGVQLRNRADYDLSSLKEFASDFRTLKAIQGATAAIGASLTLSMPILFAKLTPLPRFEPPFREEKHHRFLAGQRPTTLP
jgi:hypothetical protein